MQRSSLLAIMMTLVMVLSLQMATLGPVGEENETLLEAEEIVYEATSPGHSVLAEYIGAYWCGPCKTTSNSLHSLSQSNGDDFTYVSFWESSSTGWPSDSPINRDEHIKNAPGYTGGIPVVTFGDADQGTYYKVGGQSYDTPYQNGGNMVDATQFNLAVTQAPNGANMDVTITADYTGSGSKTVYLYAAVTEEVSPETYTGGSPNPHHVWKKWLLNSGNSGFESFTLSGTPVSKSWTVPISTVRAGGGNSATDNFLTVAALMDGSHSTYNDVYVAADSNMNPMDLSVTALSVDNADSPSSGFQSGDMLDLEATIGNTGTEDYSDGGSIQFYHVTGMNSESAIGPAITLNNLNVGQTQTVMAQFDTSSITMQSNSAENFRVRLSNTIGEKDPVGNNQRDVSISHDVAPSANRPIAAGNTEIPRGAELDFEVSGLSNDLVDTLSTQTAEMMTSPTGQNAWTDEWVGDGELMGAGTGNERFVFTVSPPNTAGSGAYDVKARMTDARGQVGEWSPVNTEAFTLQNGLPMVVDPTNPGETPASCPEYPGQPTVKVETIEFIDAAGLVCDAETPLNQLVISSTHPAFREWHSDLGQIEVKYDSVITDPLSGEAITQPMQLSISDGEDTNTGSLDIMVIENGAPRWSPLPSQSFDEGDSVSLILTQYLQDTDADGEAVSPMGLQVRVHYISNESLISAEMNGHTINIESVNDDVFGEANVILRAEDSDGQYSDTPLVVIVQNVNDAPTLDVSTFDGLRVKMGDQFDFDVVGNMYDIDDPVDAMLVTVTCDTWKVGSRYNPLSGMMTAWFEEEGTHTISIVVRDVHDDLTAYDVTIEVVDSLPLIWSESAESGDLIANVDNLYVGEQPNVTLSYHGAVELTEIEITWQICNLLSGICTDNGLETPTHQELVDGLTFVATKDDGAIYKDQVKISVQAVGSDGFDYRTQEDSLHTISQERPDEVVPDDEGENNQNSDDEQAASGSLDPVVIGIIGALVVGLLVAITLGVLLVRSGRKEDMPTVDWNELPATDTVANSAYGGSQQIFEQPVAMGPPLPPEGLPAGWTMEQWQHYGQQWLEQQNN